MGTGWNAGGALNGLQTSVYLDPERTHLGDERARDQSVNNSEPNFAPPYRPCASRASHLGAIFSSTLLSALCTDVTQA